MCTFYPPPTHRDVGRCVSERQLLYYRRWRLCIPRVSFACINSFWLPPHVRCAARLSFIALAVCWVTTASATFSVTPCMQFYSVLLLLWGQMSIYLDTNTRFNRAFWKYAASGEAFLYVIYFLLVSESWIVDVLPTRYLSEYTMYKIQWVVLWKKIFVVLKTWKGCHIWHMLSLCQNMSFWFNIYTYYIVVH